MATGDNATIPLFEPGERITAAATAPVVSGKFVKVTADMQSQPALNIAAPLTGGNLIQCAQAVAGDKAFGVAGYDAAAIGDSFPVLNGPGMVVPMVAGAAITAGQEVQSDAAANPIPLAAGKSNGMAVNSAANGATVYVRLYS